MSDHEHTEPAPDERVEGVEDLDVPADEQADVADVQHVEGAEGDDAALAAFGGKSHQVGR